MQSAQPTCCLPQLLIDATTPVHPSWTSDGAQTGSEAAVCPQALPPDRAPFAARLAAFMRAWMGENGKLEVVYGGCLRQLGQRPSMGWSHVLCLLPTPVTCPGLCYERACCLFREQEKNPFSSLPRRTRFRVPLFP